MYIVKDFLDWCCAVRNATRCKNKDRELKMRPAWLCFAALLSCADTKYHITALATNGRVSFDEFLETFALLEPLDLVAIFDKEANFFRLGSAGMVRGGVVLLRCGSVI